MMMDFVTQQETHLLNHLLTTYDPDPWRHFHPQHPLIGMEI